MTEKEIITEVERYLSDTSYNYAVMIDGDWGCGKTYFVKNGLSKAIAEHERESEKPRKIVYISLYGHKTILDIQDAIAIQLHFVSGSEKRFWSKLGKKRVVGNGVHSAITLAKAARDIFAPGASVFEFEEPWIDLASYVFIFDDVERCNCPLNEVFGFINGLVEHDGVKVILVANEKEIQIKEATDSKELQYLVAMNETIEYPKVKDFWGDEVKKAPLTIEELERRRKVVFPSNLVDEEFKKIREKLIGVTLHYQPEVKEICSEMICKSSFADGMKETLLCYLDSFYATMQNANHFNLRTFQFFLSKLKSIVDSLAVITIPAEHSDTIEQKIILDCFSCAVDFKANTQPPEDRIERITFDLSREKRSKAIELYVETGELSLDSLQEEIERYINENLIDLIPADDPYKLLQQEYYLHPQKWCEEKIGKILKKLENDDYPTIAYGEVIRPLLILEDMGFDHSYLNSVKEQMIANIGVTAQPKAPNNQLYFFEDNPVIFARAKQVLGEIEEAIAKQNNTEKVLSLDEILKREDWVDKLTPFVEQHNLKDDPNGNVFASVDSKIWIGLLKNASPEVITKFRHWFHWVYPTNLIRQNRQCDIDVLEEIAIAIDPEDANDLIVKNLQKWLKNDIEKVCALYNHTKQKTTIEAKDESNG